MYPYDLPTEYPLVVPPGPWLTEPNHEAWITAAGLPGAIIRTEAGHLCGYVALSLEHPLYSTDLEHGKLLQNEKRKYGYECFSPHGGITFDRIRNGYRWVGFDCAHHNDLIPFKKDHSFLKQIYRDWSYVKGEVERFAQELQQTFPLPTIQQQIEAIIQSFYADANCINLPDEISPVTDMIKALRNIKEPSDE